jgi:hypothetical protein
MRVALPHASFVGFTGTPIEKNDANTRAMFGDCIEIEGTRPRSRGAAPGTATTSTRRSSATSAT